MNKFFFVAVLIVSLGATSCGKIMDELSKQNGNNPSAQPTPTNASQVQFKTNQGYVAYPKASVNFVDAQVLIETNKPFQELQIRDSGSIRSHISPIKLHAPSEANPPAGWKNNITGYVTVFFNNGMDSRKLDVVNWTTLIDDQYPTTYYTSKIPLNVDWLNDSLSDQESPEFEDSSVQ